MASILEGPALAPPPGVKPNFVNPYNLTTTDRAVFGLAIAVPTIVLGLRIYSKAVVLKKVGADDYFLMAGWAFYMAYCAVTLELVHAGIARHMWDIHLIDMIGMLYKLYIELFMYNIITCLVKTSIFLQLLNIFCPPKKRNVFFWTCWILIGIIVAFYFSVTAANIWSCTPRKRFWMPWLLEGHCINIDALMVVSGVVNTAADLIIIILPQSKIWRLKMPMSRKIKASSIFFIGLFALAASAVRLYTLVQIMTQQDESWNVNQMGLWTSAELITTFICSCLPSLAQLTNHWLPSAKKFIVRITPSQFTNSTSSTATTTTTGLSTTQQNSTGNKSITLPIQHFHKDSLSSMASGETFTASTRGLGTRDYLDKDSDIESGSFDASNQV